ncbi:MAG TPA: acyltransferase [Xanthomonadaceae bacterium]|nr:acyltransferase [Xanthomonadaceae bacterium]
MSAQDWRQRPEGGTRLAIRAIRFVALRLGRPLARLLLYPITLYFVLVRGPERRASREFLARATGHRAGLVQVARHLHCFAATILDRIYLLSEQLQRFEVRIEGLPMLHEQMDKGRGLLLLGSHLGSFESLRALSATREDLDVRIVLDVRHNAALTEMLAELNPVMAGRIIDAGQDGTAIVMAIKQATDAGAVVALLADRSRPGDPVVMAPFMGDRAPFPSAPFLIASVLQVPVVLCFGFYRGGRRYDLHFELFDQDLHIERRARQQQLAAVVARYAARLEHHARRTPYNWFNFYDFWQRDLDRHDPAAGAAGDGRGRH